VDPDRTPEDPGVLLTRVVISLLHAMNGLFGQPRQQTGVQLGLSFVATS
jgi:hypothetical protein